ncbi:Mov34/MPN/PAD-1 family protein [Lacipirellula parvula]|uniref:MPN domain-containing protein n=1 Tax=Lacipirellula parvula TaxID=2650471 RepID=A0A5K7XC30_9BACT|nr:Mov34/MPN/PAD-1 family protein [Lacipirellula parvula]BBO34370.1 hypothetical protein PLANPX_3982 [Lacipirellula parvula]
MSTTDVTNLASEGLAELRFPVDYHAPFRFFLVPEVHRAVSAHAKEDTSVEICGVLVGVWGRDELGPFAQVSNFIRCDNASSKVAEVTFTHESWAQINQEMDSKYADKRIVGWYHSHPDFGIFLSDRDCFIHEHFFSGAGQVAYVVDPVRDLEGVFAWQKGKPTPLDHYWIGPEIRTVEASRRNVAKESAGRSQPALDPRGVETAVAAPSNADRSSLGTITTMLGWLALFLLGYTLAGARTRWDREMMIEGAVAHYGIMKIVALGLDQDLAKVRKNLDAIATETKKFPAANAKLTDEEAAAADKQRELVVDSLALTSKMADQIQQRYALTLEERSALVRLVAVKEAEAAAILASPPAASGTPTPPAAKAIASPPQPSAPAAKAEKTPSTAKPGDAPAASNAAPAANPAPAAPGD